MRFKDISFFTSQNWWSYPVIIWIFLFCYYGFTSSVLLESTLLVFTREERDLIIEHLYRTNNRIASISYLGFSLGMREGEILGLSWEDINQESCVLSIRRSLRYTKDFDEEGNKVVVKCFLGG